MTTYVFVYGTLRPGDVRWHFLEPFVVDAGRADTVAGQIFDTGLDYPAAVFDGSGTIHGHTFALVDATAAAALAVLDEVEGVVGGRVHAGGGAHRRRDRRLGLRLRGRPRAHPDPVRRLVPASPDLSQFPSSGPKRHV